MELMSPEKTHQDTPLCGGEATCGIPQMRVGGELPRPSPVSSGIY